MCGFRRHGVHDRRNKVTVLEVSGRHTTLVWSRRRMCCDSCGSRVLAQRQLVPAGDLGERSIRMHASSSNPSRRDADCPNGRMHLKSISGRLKTFPLVGTGFKHSAYWPLARRTRSGCYVTPIRYCSHDATSGAGISPVTTAVIKACRRSRRSCICWAMCLRA